MPTKAELQVEVEAVREEWNGWRADMVGLTAARARQLERAHVEVRKLEGEVERGGRELVAADMELQAERDGRKEEEDKRKAAEAKVEKLEVELAGEKRRREEDRDMLMGVVKAMQEGTEVGRARWLDWEKKARWGWFGQGKYGWSRDGGSSSSSSSNGRG